MKPSDFPTNDAPGWRPLRQNLMAAACDVLTWMQQSGRSLSTEGFALDVAERAGVELPSQGEYTVFLPWVLKAREMATEYQHRAEVGGGQYPLF